jgi:hypothetical protein
MEIDIDQEKANQPITRRERISIYILLIIFYFICPAKYVHQVKVVTEKIEELMK